MAIHYKNLFLILGFCLLWSSYRITLLLWRKGRTRLSKDDQSIIEHGKPLSDLAIIILSLIYLGRVIFMFIIGYKSDLALHVIPGGLFAMIPLFLVGIIFSFHRIKE